MSTAEITAFLLGSRLRAEGQPLSSFLSRSYERLMLDLGEDDGRALARLGRDVWAHWVYRGYWEEPAWRG